MAVLVRGLAVLASIVIVPALAAAQSANTQPPAEAPAAPPPAAPASSDAADAPPAASAKPVFPATGYSYGGPSTAEAAPPPRAERTRPRAPQANPGGTEAVMAGFETLADGSTRLFVELSKAVSFDSKSTGSTLTVVLKDAKVDRRNNQNPMVTVHFNTPVTSARLVPHGHDVWFVVDLRSAVQPAVTLAGGDSAKDPSAFLRIAFPKGEYLGQAAPGAPPSKAQAARTQASATAAAP